MYSQYGRELTTLLLWHKKTISPGIKIRILFGPQTMPYIHIVQQYS